MNIHPISIIMPVYNSEGTLNRAVDSILKQSYSNFELILVDDGSTDKSGAICDEYAKKILALKLFTSQMVEPTLRVTVH